MISPKISPKSQIWGKKYSKSSCKCMGIRKINIFLDLTKNGPNSLKFAQKWANILKNSPKSRDLGQNKLHFMCHARQKYLQFSLKSTIFARNRANIVLNLQNILKNGEILSKIISIHDARTSKISPIWDKYPQKSPPTTNNCPSGQLFVRNLRL